MNWFRIAGMRLPTLKLNARCGRAVSAIFALAVAGVVAAGCRTSPPNSLATHNSDKWKNEIAAIEARVATNRPPPGCIIFFGSSGIQRWANLAADFPDLPVYNHGFGGSQLADLVNFADRVIVPFQPREVVIYAGGNDINAHKDPVVVFGDFVALVSNIHAALPRTRIAYISSAPNLKRWAQVKKVERLNSLAAAYCRRHGMDFINVFPRMLGAEGRPRPDIFVEDGLHMNAAGYAIWAAAVRPFLK